RARRAAGLRAGRHALGLRGDLLRLRDVVAALFFAAALAGVLRTTTARIAMARATAVRVVVAGITIVQTQFDAARAFFFGRRGRTVVDARVAAVRLTLGRRGLRTARLTLVVDLGDAGLFDRDRHTLGHALLLRLVLAAGIRRQEDPAARFEICV